MQAFSQNDNGLSMRMAFFFYIKRSGPRATPLKHLKVMGHPGKDIKKQTGRLEISARSMGSIFFKWIPFEKSTQAAILVRLLLLFETTNLSAEKPPISRFEPSQTTGHL